MTVSPLTNSSCKMDAKWMTLLMITALLFFGTQASGKTLTIDFTKGLISTPTSIDSNLWRTKGKCTKNCWQMFSTTNGDSIEFYWENDHNVYLMMDKQAFEDCVWDGTETIVGNQMGNKTTPLEMKSSNRTVWWFACGVADAAHCR